jgi:two-component SAPR family response regulator
LIGRNLKLEQKKALIVEDEVLMRLMLKKFITSQGWQVVAEASSAEEAFSKFEDSNCSLVFMDINLEGDMKGDQLAAELLKLREVNIVFISAYPKSKVDIPDSPMIRGYFQKPVTYDLVAGLLNEL